MKKTLFCTIASLLVSSTAMAGGYQLQEYSVTNLGRAFGGAGITGDDYSAIAFNPAGMGYKGTGVQLGANYIHIRAIAKGSLSSDPTVRTGEATTRTVLPHFFAQKQINDNLTLGAGVYVPFGLGTYYKKGWYGRTHALNSEISTIDLAGAVSYKLTNGLSVGGSVFAEKLDARLTSRTDTGQSDLNADDWSWGYNVGLAFEPVKDTRFGLTYRSKTIHKISGPHYLDKGGVTYIGDCGTKLVLPEHVLLTAYQKVGDFGLSAMARWTRWSRFAKLSIHSEAYRQVAGTPNTPTVDEDWRNVWMVGAGSDYYLNENWTLRAGVAFDQGAVKRAENRTARVPDSNRWILGTGVSYMLDNWQVDVSYAHMFLKHAHSYNRYPAKPYPGTTLDAKSQMGSDLVGVSLQYNF